MDFVQRVLQWDLRTVKEPQTLSMLPKKHDRISTYYESFIPHIMEESRAVIHQGLAKDHKSSVLRLTSNVSEPRARGNPWIFNFRGRIKIEEDSPYMNVLLLTPLKKGAPKKWMLAIASNLDGVVKAKARVFPEFFKHRGCFMEGQSWRATYLGCLVTHERMFNACQRGHEDSSYSEINYPTVRKIACGDTPAPIAEAAATTSNLNPGQNHAITAFLSLTEKGTLLLQGPPGTGKTTTLVTLLQRLRDQRTLVCAASNKAIQVLAERFYDEHRNDAMILVGVEDKIPDKLKPISLNHWLNSVISEIDKRVKQKRRLLADVESALDDEPQDSVEDRDNIMENLDTTPLKAHFKAEDEHLQRLEIRFRVFSISVSSMTANLRAALKNASNDDLYPDKWIEKLTTQCEQLETLSAALRNQEDTIKTKLLNRAHWIFCTLSTAGRTQLAGGAKDLPPMTEVDNLVVDEAAQSVEAETLIAFQHRPKRVILVGDTQQLPATVISEHAKHFHYDWSMMWRLQEDCGQRTLMLNEQYRMHPEICRFPSARWYEGRLQTAASLRYDAVDSNSLIRPYTFYNMSNDDNRMQKQGTSSYNTKEANYVAKVVEVCRQQHGDKRIGIITFYSAQVEAIQKALQAAKQPHNSNMVRVSSVDGFQGGEADIIILSFVRAPEANNKAAGIGFLNDFRRLNVALTRAKSTLIMLGHADTLGRGKDTDLHALLKDAKRRKHFHEEHALKERLGLPSVVSASKKGKQATTKLKKATETSGLETQMASLSLDDPKLNPQASLKAFTPLVGSAPNPQGQKRGKGGGRRRFFRSQSQCTQQSGNNKAGIEITATQTSTAANSPAFFKDHQPSTKKKAPNPSKNKPKGGAGHKASQTTNAATGKRQC